jgi:enhancing lycopene biosynthesis protein 2
MKKKIGFVLSGCGVYDGAEIHESVLAMLALTRKGYELVFLAPNVEQAHVMNHQEGAPSEGETRNVMIEAARIARGPVTDIAKVSAADFHGIFFPGGFGAAKNLCSFALEGEAMKVNPAVEKLILDCHAAGKPMGFVCIAPVLAAKVLGNGVEVTLGTDEGIAAKVNAMGGTHVAKPVHQAHIDQKHRVVTAPAYMSAQNILEVEASINSAVEAFAALLA